MECANCKRLEAQIDRLLVDLSNCRSNWESTLCTNELVLAQNERLAAALRSAVEALGAIKDEYDAWSPA